MPNNKEMGRFWSSMASALQKATDAVPTAAEKPMSIRRQRRMRAADVSTLATPGYNGTIGTYPESDNPLNRQQIEAVVE